MKNKTLLVSCATLSSGGSERVLSILSNCFANEYEKVIYVMWVHRPIFFKVDERIHLVDLEEEAGTKNIVKKMIWFRKFVYKTKPDLILSFLYPWSMKVISSLMFTPFKIIVSERRDARFVRGGEPVRMLRNLLYHRACGIVLQTDSNKQYYRGKLTKKLKVIYNPLQIENQYLGLGLKTKKEDVVVAVGRLRFEKNYEYLIRSFNKFHLSHPTFRLIIYGEGEERDKLTNLIHELKLDNHVLLPGRTKEVFAKIADARIYVLSSVFEGMPNALLEAMCTGLPCISTKVSGATELIKNRVNGILVDNGDEMQLANAMGYLADNPEFAHNLATEAVKLIDIINVKKISNEWLEYLNKFI